MQASLVLKLVVIVSSGCLRDVCCESRPAVPWHYMCRLTGPTSSLHCWYVWTSRSEIWPLRLRCALSVEKEVMCSSSRSSSTSCAKPGPASIGLGGERPEEARVLYSVTKVMSVQRKHGQSPVELWQTAYQVVLTWGRATLSCADHSRLRRRSHDKAKGLVW
ncbi:hypothetical protein BD289DRAFT_294402 [Coniella lustricola]|uniref:Secreted protein n=1 Tax=Coniella lustricola TaxID=2025994 RepID=A0A2T3A4U3_9PEZI|nr:hypothetical protein BD289DRAFT_294402 [Coniella lustricola]